MANSLLDFVMSLVRDPNAAAAYAADPGGAIADANLTDVTSVDVNNLIPVVAESLSMAMPATGANAALDHHVSNVWTSGAATAAFDAFDDHVPAVAIDDVHTTAAHLITEPDVVLQSGVDAFTDIGVPDVATSLEFDGPVNDDVPAIDTHAGDGWSHVVPEDHHLGADGSGFDIFDS